RLFSNTASEYETALDEDDLTLIRLCEEIEQSKLIKRFLKKNIRPSAFFWTVFDEKMFSLTRPKIEQKLNQIFSLLGSKPFFLMSKEGWPVESPLFFAREPASVLFHFRRTEEELRYFPTLKYEGMRLEFMFKNAEVI